jgi:hypothetical protein
MLALCLTLAPGIARSELSIDEKIEDLQRQLDELRALQQSQRVDQQSTPQLPVDEVSEDSEDGSTPASPTRPELSFGGQYRINFYSVDNGYTESHEELAGRQTSQRMRIRQNVDIAFNQQFRTHLQFELHHTTDNVTTTDHRRGGKSTELSVRHAVMDYTWRTGSLFDGTNVQAGLVPLDDYFDQALFSADWNYNPLAAAFIIPAGPTSIRLFAANLEEGSESNVNDDFVHYQADVTMPFGDDGRVTLTGTALNIAAAGNPDSNWHYNYGIGGYLPLGSVTVSGFVLGSSTNRELLGGNNDADGIALRAELSGSLGPGTFGLLTTHATGKDEGSGFLMPMAFARSFGYWGYTGILTVQGPTDTGFDFDAVNISNNGYGMSSIQARYSFPLTDNLGVYFAAGWFGNTNAPNRSSTVGTDGIVMGTYLFNRVLALDFGIAYAQLKDSVSGYFQGVQSNSGLGGAAFNQSEGEDRDKWALFGRLQAEF